MFSVRFADAPASSGYNRNGFTTIAAARSWAVDYLRQQNTIDSNPFDPTLLIVDASGEVRDQFSREDPRVLGEVSCAGFWRMDNDQES